MWEAPEVGNRRSVGLDVPARSVVACGVDGRTGDMFERRLTPDRNDAVSWPRSLPGPLAATAYPHAVALETMAVPAQSSTSGYRAASRG